MASVERAWAHNLWFVTGRARSNCFTLGTKRAFGWLRGEVWYARWLLGMCPFPHSPFGRLVQKLPICDDMAAQKLLYPLWYIRRRQPRKLSRQAQGSYPGSQ